MGAPEDAASALPELHPAAAGDPLFDVEKLAGLEFAVEVPLGSVRVDVRRLVHLKPGSVLTLEKTTGEPLEVHVNGTPIARGEVRVQGERFAIRVTEILGAPRRDENPGEESSRAQVSAP